MTGVPGTAVMNITGVVDFKFRCDLNIVYVLLGISPASICNLPTFRNHVSVPSSKAGSL